MDKETKTEAIEEKKTKSGGAWRKGYDNLKPIPINTLPPEKQLEIRRKAAAATNKIKGEKKTAQQSLESILDILASDSLIDKSNADQEIINKLKRSGIDVTIYDLMQVVAIGRALDGNIKAYETIRDTAGDKPKEKLDITAQSLTEADRELLQAVNDRLNEKIIDTESTQ